MAGGLSTGTKQPRSCSQQTALRIPKEKHIGHSVLLHLLDAAAIPHIDQTNAVIRDLPPAIHSHDYTKSQLQVILTRGEAVLHQICYNGVIAVEWTTPIG